MASRTLFNDVSQRLSDDVLPALVRAASIDPESFLRDLRRRGLQARRLEDLRQLDLALIDPIAASLVEATRRISAVSGVGLGMGGWLGIAPEVVGQLALLLKLAQRLSLVYGIDYRTRSGEVLLWKAMARGVGVEAPVEGKPRQGGLPARLGGASVAVNPVATRLATAVLRRLALRTASPLGRMVPLLGSGVGMWSNYAQMGRTGRRMMAFYRKRRLVIGDDDLVEVEVIRRTIEGVG